MTSRILVTGGAGFIGSALVHHLIDDLAADVLVIDKLTYAGNLASLAPVADRPGFRFLQADICDGDAMGRAVAGFRPDAIVHLAAESHVDRSIDDAGAFIQTNVVGTVRLLEAATAYWRGLDAAQQARFRFVNVSTDEVFGSLGDEGRFDAHSPHAPRSPYSASKAGGEHLARAWFHTHGLPVLTTNCSNNYGPRQFPEKLIPLTILRGFSGETLPVYGDGHNVRDWLHVEDHARALAIAALHGQPGATYLIGGNAERTNLQVVQTICDLLDRHAARADGQSHRAGITFVPDRPGHDHRYAVDSARITRELGWQPRHAFADGLAATVRWYLDNAPWWQAIQSGSYRGERLGLALS